MSECKQCADTQALFLAEGKDEGVAYRKAMRAHADGHHKAAVIVTDPPKAKK